jgi:hypothetical protein
VIAADVILKSSDLADVYYLGVGKTVACLGPLLQRPSENPRATLLTMFMGAVGEAERLRVNDNPTKRDHIHRAYAKLVQYESMVRLYQTPIVCEHMLHGAVQHVRDHESLFEE